VRPAAARPRTREAINAAGNVNGNVTALTDCVCRPIARRPYLAYVQRGDRPKKGQWRWDISIHAPVKGCDRPYGYSFSGGSSKRNSQERPSSIPKISVMIPFIVHFGRPGQSFCTRSHIS